jgi:uncharacterized protein (TIGR03000 family)
MFRNTRAQMVAFVAIGALSGYLAASGRLNPSERAEAAQTPSTDFGLLGKAKAEPPAGFTARATATSQTGESHACCSEGSIKGELLALAESKAGQAAGNLQAPLAGQAAALATAQGEAVEAIAFEVMVPADAILEIDGDRTKETGEVRTFQTPPLKVGGRYNYNLKATARGKTVTRQLHLTHGGANTIDLRPDFQGTRGGTSATRVAKAPANSAKPNILFIMGDDIGWMQRAAITEV